MIELTCVLDVHVELAEGKPANCDAYSDLKTNSVRQFYVMEHCVFWGLNMSNNTSTILERVYV